LFIESLKLESFKGFKNFTVELKPFTCLVGLNSRGKTSILQAIQLLHDLVLLTFGNKEYPNYSHPSWSVQSPNSSRKLGLSDFAAIWLSKRTSEACKIEANYTNGARALLEITGNHTYALDIQSGGMSLKKNTGNPLYQELIKEIYALRPVYVPPVGMISPDEEMLYYPAMSDKVDAGRHSECWRSSLYWLYNDGQKERFDEIVSLVQQYLPDARICPPRLTHEHRPKVQVEFEEEDVLFDIGISGGGMRSLLNIATILRYSITNCILCDEPDSHLHPSLQRAICRMLRDHCDMMSRQVIVASHAPDFIAEVPAEALLWIDRRRQCGEQCSNIGKVLIDLGAVSSTDAIRCYNADKLLFVEGDVDQTVLSELFEKSGHRNPFTDEHVLTARLPNGKGDKKYLSVLHRFLREALSLDVKIGCITDNDYELEQADETTRDGAVLICSLPFKEVENLLLDPNAISVALKATAEKRKNSTGQEIIGLPGVEDIRKRLDEIVSEREIEEKVRCQLLPRYRNGLERHLDDATKEQRADRWFDEQWKDPEWRLRNVPGKDVFRSVRRWCQSSFGITVGPLDVVQTIVECPGSIVELAEKMESHLYGIT